MDSKVCTRCGEQKLLTDFSPLKGRTGGHARCKACACRDSHRVRHEGLLPASILRKRDRDESDRQRIAALTKKTDGDECWEWLGSKAQSGHSRCSFRGGPAPAYRALYILTYGELPVGGVVRHTCDNPGCVRIDHLLLGTQADNMRDAVERHRIPWGEQRRNSKLRAVQVLEIRQLLRDGLTDRDIARRFGVSRSAIYHIRTGATWKRLD